MEQGILPLQQAVSAPVLSPQAAVHEPGSLTPLDLHRASSRDEAAERALHQAPAPGERSAPETTGCTARCRAVPGGQHHHQQGVLQVFMKMGGGDRR